MVSTSTTRGQVSPPQAPAFIASAPPIVPGMPAKKSAGPSCHLAHCLPSRAHGTPASARTRSSPTRSSEFRMPCTESTTPRMPPSRTSRLLPRPTQVTGTSAGSARRKADRSSTSRGENQASAGPPTCQDVCRDIGSSRCTRSMNSPGDREPAHRRALALVTPSRAGQLVRHRADAARTHGQHDVAVGDDARERRRQLAHVLDEYRLEPAAPAHRAADRAPVGIRDRLLARRVDLGHEQRVGRRQRAAEVVDQVACARVAVRLEREHQPPARPGLAHGVHRRLDLGRVMAVVVDQRHATGARRDFAHHLEPPADALEARECALDRRVLDLELGRDRDRRERVPHVVHAGQVQRDRKRRPAGADHVETGRCALALEPGGADVCVLAEPVAHGRSADLGQDLAHDLVVAAHHRETVERQVVQELDEALLELLEVAAVRAQVVVVDVGDDRDHRLQVQERGVALVRLRDQVAAGAELRVAAGALQQAADHERRVEAALGEHRGDEARSRGLAVRARRPRCPGGSA